MSSLHPHWHTTDEDERPVRINAAVPAAVMPQIQQAPVIERAKRTPAAFIGIALFAAIGFAAFQGVSGMVGQILDDGTPIRITQTGVVPLVLTIKPGDKITWINESTIPHILSSETLPTNDNKPFMSTAILPSSKYSYTVPSDALSGTNDYISETSEVIMGQIIIDPAAPLQAVTTSSAGFAVTSSVYSSQATVPAYVPVAAVSSAAVSSAGFAFSNIPASTDDATFVGNTIPQNPYTVGTSNTPLPSRQQAKTINTQINEHRPMSQPETGMGAWMIGMLSFVAFWMVCRKALALK